MFTAHSLKTPEMLSSVALGHACLNLVQGSDLSRRSGSYSLSTSTASISTFASIYISSQQLAPRFPVYHSSMPGNVS